MKLKTRKNKQETPKQTPKQETYFKKALDYDISNMIDPTKLVKKLPKRGVWLPISIAAELSDISGQMVRYLYMNEIIRSIKFKTGPKLVDYEEIKTNWTDLE